MSIRYKFILFFVGLHLFAASSTYYYELIYMKEKFIETSVNKSYENRKAQYEHFLEEETQRLNAFAKELSTNTSVLRAYREDDRQILIDRFESFWQHMAKDALIKEIHFFKKPAISFVNFANVKAYNIDASDVRGDIGWVTSSFQPSTHFLVCRLYPGLRATYPVISDDTMLGGVSLGIDMHRLAANMQKLFNVQVYFALKDSGLRKGLNHDSYDAIAKEGALQQEYRFFGDVGELDETMLQDKLIYRNRIAYSIFPIRDFNRQGIGYFIFKDDLSDKIAFFEGQSWQTFFYYSGVGILVFLAILLMINRAVKTLDEMMGIMQNIREKSFEKLAAAAERLNTDGKGCDEICRFERQLVQTGQEIKNYLDLLTKEMHDYADKAHLDALTQVFNRHAIKDIGENLFLKAQLAHQPMAVMMLDLDNFKPVNDTYGHDFGDVVLKHVADQIGQVLRSDDFLARYGGEEFIVMLPKTTVERAYEVAGKICRSVGSETIGMGEKQVRQTVSIGLTEVHEEDTSLAEAIKRADEKLYIAKQNGKNRIEV